jgi:hypothetical protein
VVTIESTAYHEAAHVACFVLTGIGVRSVALRGNGDDAGRTEPLVVPVRDPALLRAYLIGVLAGPLAVGRGIRWVDESLISADADSGDAEAAAVVAGRLGLTEHGFDRTVAVTRALLARPDVRRQVAAVQRALLRHGSLDGDEAAEIVRAA